MQIYENLQFSSEFQYFKNHYNIVYYQLSLFIVNVGKCDHIILFFIIFLIFMKLSLSICHYFYKKYFILNDKTQPLVTVNWPIQPHSSIHK